MKTLLVTYTLNSFKDQYAVIREKITSYPKWARISQYSWLIKTDDSISNVRSDLKATIQEKGSILVIDVTNAPWATYAVSKNVTDWMKENV